MDREDGAGYRNPQRQTFIIIITLTNFSFSCFPSRFHIIIIYKLLVLYYFNYPITRNYYDAVLITLMGSALFKANNHLW